MVAEGVDWGGEVSVGPEEEGVGVDTKVRDQGGDQAVTKRCELCCPDWNTGGKAESSGLNLPGSLQAVELQIYVNLKMRSGACAAKLPRKHACSIYVICFYAIFLPCGTVWFGAVPSLAQIRNT